MLIGAGAISYETALGLSLGQITFLFRQYHAVEAMRRRAFIEDTRLSIAPFLSTDDKSLNLLKKHLTSLTNLFEPNV